MLRFNDVGAVYIFARDDGTKWTALYIGQTEELGTRISGHEKWTCAREMGATHIHICRIATELCRKKGGVRPDLPL